jgi:hypothetical protein
MKMSISDLNGRLLEYLIVKEISDNHKCILPQSTINNQLRDVEKEKMVDLKLLNKFKLSSIKIRTWLLDKIDLENSTITRHSDSSGVSGDVSDITIENIMTNQKLNFSIKHNHLALKHQRPASTPQQIGFIKQSIEDLIFRSEYGRIFDDFISKSKNLNPNVVLYSDVVEIIPSTLYTPMCKLVSDFLNQYGMVSDKSNNYMRFLIGNTNFTKIVVNEKDIILYKFQDLPYSNSMKSTVIGDKNILVDFQNGIKVNMRIHTASSRFKTNSLKFDTQPHELKIPFETISL